MGKIKIFDNWTFQLPLPEPFASEAGRTGKRYTTYLERCSLYNHMRKGRRATFHGPTLEALLYLSKVINGEEKGAFGICRNRTTIKNYCCEYVKTEGDGSIKEVRGLVYLPDEGIFKGCVKCDGSTNSTQMFQQICSNGGNGKELLALLAYASICEGPCYEREFAEFFGDFHTERIANRNEKHLINNGYILCDNLYRRIVGNEEKIKLDEDRLASGVIDFLSDEEREKKSYNATRVDYGEFVLLNALVKAETRTKGNVATVGEVGEQYKMPVFLSKEEQEQIPCLPENYQVSEDVLDILNSVSKTPLRVFICLGDAGTGKSTNAKIVAQLLGLPYYSFLCNADMEASDLLATMIPNTGTKKETEQTVYPTFREIMLDPGYAVSKLTGEYKEEIEVEDAFQSLLEAAYKKGYQRCKEQKDYAMVESAIIKGCRRPAVVEIQEANILSREATLMALNGLLDDGKSVTLISGEMVSRHPDSVFILTGNVGYKGCKELNESVLSRMSMAFYSSSLTAQEMVKRVEGKVKNFSSKLLLEMAETICEIQKYRETELIRGGVCGYREYENWVWACLIKENITDAALSTVVSKAASEEEDRDDIYKNFILAKFSGRLVTAA